MNAALTLWACATAGHVALMGFWLHRSGLSRSRDEFWFLWMLASTGSLAATVHLTALVSGLTLTTGLVTLAGFHGAIAVIDRLRRPAVSGETPARTLGVLESLATVVLCAVVVSWALNASLSLDVIGTDAAHYHVPAAVNLALGANLFGLPATPHLYPLASSALVAWFILPLRDALLIELAMLLPFLLLASGSAWIFRLVTGLSGLAWTTWLTLALFSTPLFRAASLVSADLLFAAAYVALVAQLLSLLRGADRAAGLPLAGLSTGLLLGSKTTGLPAAVLLWMSFLALRLLIGEAPPRLSRGRLAAALLGTGALSIAAGGIWLVRNWIVWGSPVAPTGLTVAGIEIFGGLPHEASYYLSVLGDQKTDPAYPLWERLARYIRIWLGSWYLLALLPAGILLVDTLIAWTRPSTGEARSQRAVIALVFASGVPLAWLLAGAPWTSLEWTGGFSLRYVLPLAALLPLLALLGCFPSTLPWFTRHTPVVCAGAVFAAAALVLLRVSQGPEDVHPPRIEWLPLAIGSLLWAAHAILRRRPRPAPALTLGVIVLAGVWSAVVSPRDVAARDAAERASGARTPDRLIYQRMLQAEQERGLTCGARRIFVLVRFDAPLALQSVEYRNQVLYAARDLAVSARADPMTRCDYIVTTRPVIETDRGQRMIATLNRFADTWELGEAPPFVLLGRR